MAKQSSAALDRFPPSAMKPPSRTWETLSVRLVGSRLIGSEGDIYETESAMFSFLGLGGYELVTVTEDAGFNRRYYFKRPA